MAIALVARVPDIYCLMENLSYHTFRLIVEPQGYLSNALWLPCVLCGENNKRTKAMYRRSSILLFFALIHVPLWLFVLFCLSTYLMLWANIIIVFVWFCFINICYFTVYIYLLAYPCIYNCTYFSIGGCVSSLYVPLLSCPPPLLSSTFRQPSARPGDALQHSRAW